MKNLFLTFIVLLAVCFFSTACNEKKDRVLFDFESASELDRLSWKCHMLFSISDEHIVHGNHSLKFEFFPSSYPGLSCLLKQKNWQGYSSFQFNVYNPDDLKTQIVVRIDDKENALEHNDRYNKAFTLQPGMNTITIPLARVKTSGGQRNLNLRTITQFIVFMSHPKKHHQLYFDYFRLT